MITTSILGNSIDSIAWIGIIRDRGIGVVNRYRRELRLSRICTQLYILRNAHLLACHLPDVTGEGLLAFVLAPRSLFLTRLR